MANLCEWIDTRPPLAREATAEPVQGLNAMLPALPSNGSKIVGCGFGKRRNTRAENRRSSQGRIRDYIGRGAWSDGLVSDASFESLRGVLTLTTCMETSELRNVSLRPGSSCLSRAEICIENVLRAFKFFKLHQPAWSARPLKI